MPYGRYADLWPNDWRCISKHLVVENRMCFIEVIDTAGQGTLIGGVSINIISWCLAEDYAPLRDQWVRWISIAPSYPSTYWCAFLQRRPRADPCASRSTFYRLEMFHKFIQRIKHGDHIVAMLVGNQGDKTCDREVSEEEGAALAPVWL